MLLPRAFVKRGLLGHLVTDHFAWHATDAAYRSENIEATVVVDVHNLNIDVVAVFWSGL